MATLSGYLSERHVVMFILIGSFPAAAALLWLGGRLRPSAAFATSCGLLGILLLVELPVLAKPLHGNRAGHKAAGRWLASVITSDDTIVDPFNWAEFYAHPPLPPPVPPHPKNWYVVLENSDNQHSRLPALADAKKTAAV